MDQCPDLVFFNAVMRSLVSKELLSWRDFMLLTLNHLKRIIRNSGDVGPFVPADLVKDFQNLFSKELERIRERHTSHLPENMWVTVIQCFNIYIEIFVLEVKYEEALSNIRFWKNPPPGEAPDPEAIKESWEVEARNLKNNIDVQEQRAKSLDSDNNPIIKDKFFPSNN